MNEKILVLGNETVDTDIQTTKLAEQHNSTNHGLVSDPEFEPKDSGFYHTCIPDLNEGEIVRLSEKYDKIKLLDQAQDQYPNYKTLLRTFRLLKTLEQQGHTVDYKDNKNIQRHEYWYNFLRTNKSFCKEPFINLIPDFDKTVMCPRNSIPVKDIKDITDWRTDKDYKVFRNSMLTGSKLGEQYCGACYEREHRGIESQRQYETLEWAVRMQYDSPADFDNIESPLVYELRFSNKCNLMCRMCDDVRSHLIAKESRKLGLKTSPISFTDTDIDVINLNAERIYFGGGEPTIMPEFYQFLEKLQSAGKTDIELCIGTNGMKISTKLRRLLEPFSNVLFSFSFDGFGRLNDYIRWRSDFNTVVKNSRLLRQDGHKIGLQTVCQMYNVTRLHEILEFYDQEFPDSTSLVQAANGKDDALLPWNHPRADLVLDTVERCRKTKIYHTAGRGMKSYVDNIYRTYSDPNFKYDPYLLGKFFQYTDMLDKERKVRLQDFVPELEECRKLAKFQDIVWLKPR